MSTGLGSALSWASYVLTCNKPKSVDGMFSSTDDFLTSGPNADPADYQPTYETDGPHYWDETKQARATIKLDVGPHLWPASSARSGLPEAVWGLKAESDGWTAHPVYDTSQWTKTTGPPGSHKTEVYRHSLAPVQVTVTFDSGDPETISWPRPRPRPFEARHCGIMRSDGEGTVGKPFFQTLLKQSPPTAQSSSSASPPPPDSADKVKVD